MNPTKILIIDDTPMIHSLLKRGLDNQNIPTEDILDFYTGDAALLYLESALAQEKKEQYLIFMDFEMPGMNGALTTQKIREMEADIVDPDYKPACIFTHTTTSKIDRKMLTQFFNEHYCYHGSNYALDKDQCEESALEALTLYNRYAKAGYPKVAVDGTGLNRT